MNQILLDSPGTDADIKPGGSTYTWLCVIVN